MKRIIGAGVVAAVLLALLAIFVSALSDEQYEDCRGKVETRLLDKRSETALRLTCELQAETYCGLSRQDAREFCDRVVLDFDRIEWPKMLFEAILSDLRSHLRSDVPALPAPGAAPLDPSSAEEEACRDVAERALARAERDYRKEFPAGHCELRNVGIVKAFDASGAPVLNGQGEQKRTCEWQVLCRARPGASEDKVTDSHTGVYDPDASRLEREKQGLPVNY